MLVLEGLGGLHRTIQLHLLLHYVWVDLDYSDVERFALEMNRDHSVMFEMHPSTAFWTFFVDSKGYSISSKGFLPRVIDTMAIWIKFAHSHPFYFTDSSNINVHCSFSWLTTSNSPGFMDLTLRFLYNTLLYSIRHYFCHQTHTHWVSFLFWFSLFILSGEISNWPPCFPSGTLNTFWLGSLLICVISFFLFILLWDSGGKNWSGLPFPPAVDHVLLELFTMTRRAWVAVNGMLHCYIELYKPVHHDRAVILEGGHVQ